MVYVLDTVNTVCVTVIQEHWDQRQQHTRALREFVTFHQFTVITNVKSSFR